MSKNSKHEQIKKLARKIQNKLLDEGFIIHRYDSFSSNSIYLKLNYGFAHSIRISDHKGKSHLDYRYNVLLNIEKHVTKRTAKGRNMYFYGPSCYADMVRFIIHTKKLLIEKYGDRWYNFQVEKYSMNTSTTGFWSNAYRVENLQEKKDNVIISVESNYQEGQLSEQPIKEEVDDRPKDYRNRRRLQINAKEV